MASLIWRAWAASCLLAGTVVVPLFLEVFAGGSPARFLALPLRWAWAWWLVRPLLAERWLPPRAVAVAVAGFCALVSGVTLVDLFGHGSFHPGWFLTLEWWQRPVWPWLELLPRSLFRYRPGYLWIASVWNLVEALFVGTLLWRWRPGAGARPARALGRPG